LARRGEKQSPGKKRRVSHSLLPKLKEKQKLVPPPVRWCESRKGGGRVKGKKKVGSFPKRTGGSGGVTTITTVMFLVSLAFPKKKMGKRKHEWGLRAWYTKGAIPPGGKTSRSLAEGNRGG